MVYWGRGNASPINKSFINCGYVQMILHKIIVGYNHLLFVIHKIDSYQGLVEGLADKASDLDIYFLRFLLSSSIGILDVALGV